MSNVKPQCKSSERTPVPLQDLMPLVYIQASVRRYNGHHLVTEVFLDMIAIRADELVGLMARS